MSPEVLHGYTKERLVTLARREGIRGYGSMRKQELIAALAKPKTSPARKTAAQPDTVRGYRRNGARSRTVGCRPNEDLLQISLTSRNWLKAEWQVSQETWNRAEIALATDRYDAQLVLRVYALPDRDYDSGTQRLLQQVVVERDESCWYVRLPDSIRVRAELGLLKPHSRFQSLVASSPLSGNEPADASRPTRVTENPAATLSGRQHAEQLTNRQIAALAAAERSRRRGDAEHESDFPLSVTADLVLSGRTAPDSEVTVEGKPVLVEPDGRFVVQIPLTQGRQVIPTVAAAPAGLCERTVVFAIESSTRELEPRTLHDQ